MTPDALHTLTHPQHPEMDPVPVTMTRVVDEATHVVTYTMTDDQREGATGKAGTGPTTAAALRSLAALLWPDKAAHDRPVGRERVATMQTQSDSAVTP